MRGLATTPYGDCDSTFAGKGQQEGAAKDEPQRGGFTEGEVGPGETFDSWVVLGNSLAWFPLLLPLVFCVFVCLFLPQILYGNELVSSKHPEKGVPTCQETAGRPYLPELPSNPARVYSSLLQRGEKGSPVSPPPPSGQFHSDVSLRQSMKPSFHPSLRPVTSGFRFCFSLPEA